MKEYIKDHSGGLLVIGFIIIFLLLTVYLPGSFRQYAGIVFLSSIILLISVAINKKKNRSIDGKAFKLSLLKGMGCLLIAASVLSLILVYGFENIKKGKNTSFIVSDYDSCIVVDQECASTCNSLRQGGCNCCLKYKQDVKTVDKGLKERFLFIFLGGLPLVIAYAYTRAND